LALAWSEETWRMVGRADLRRDHDHALGKLSRNSSRGMRWDGEEIKIHSVERSEHS
jgi:hypothetical protein